MEIKDSCEFIISIFTDVSNVNGNHLNLCVTVNVFFGNVAIPVLTG